MIFAVSSVFRLAKAGFVFARFGVFSIPDTSEMPGPLRLAIKVARTIERKDMAADGMARLSNALAALGPSYIKLGQFLATRRDLVGDEMAADLSRLQDKLPAFGRERAIKTIEAALGAPLDELYSEFSEPIAAASIAQVHKATTVDGRTVAVKVLRPGVIQRFEKDLRTFYFATRWLERLSPEARRLRPVAVIDTLARTTVLETDFRLEAAAISEMAENVAKDQGFRVPGLDWSRTAKSVLTIEWIDGIPMSDPEEVKKTAFDMPTLGAGVIQHFLRHAMRDGFFHADMHQGNLFVDDTGTLVAVDFGIMGRLSPRERRFLAEILFGFIRRDYRRVAEVHFEANYVPSHHDVDSFAQALRAIGEPLMDRSAEDISMARLLTQLFQVTDLFDMRTQPQLLLLQKTMVVVEGVARTLDPKVNMWVTAEPVVREWIEANLGPPGKLRDAADGAQMLAQFIGHVPALLSRAENVAQLAQKASEDGLPLSQETVDAIAAAEAKKTRSGRVALWVGAVALAIIALEMIW
ncbi:MAG: 2-polyprenylphenol 6-hydroxylase [Pseudomonadota bacterium]